MAAFAPPVPVDDGHRAYLFLKTDQGLRIGYDGTGPYPSVTIHNQDGEVELRGASEISAAAGALRCAAKVAATFIPANLLQWRARHV